MKCPTAKINNKCRKYQKIYIVFVYKNEYKGYNENVFLKKEREE